MKYSFQRFFIVFSLLFSGAANACECPQLEPISEEQLESYNVVFYGKVDSVSSMNAKGKAYFKIFELYKGNVGQYVIVNFDAVTDCMMSFYKDEEWLIYGVFQRFDELNVKICGHSRKHFYDVSQDHYQMSSLRSFEDEQQFLITKLSIISFASLPEIISQQNNFRPHNEQPSAINKMLLLLCSFLVMVIVYFITRKK